MVFPSPDSRRPETVKHHAMSACVSRFRVRFAPVSTSECKDQSSDLPLTCAGTSIFTAPEQPDERKRDRSRFGCRPCKRRRVKCDETYPVCLRCQRRGEFCEAPSRSRHAWQPETPWLLQNPSLQQQTDASAKPDTKLLQYWLERASQIMAIDPDNNPMSFPILRHLSRCTSLVHALQSVGAAHQHFFHPTKMQRCLEERALAIEHIRKELDAPGKDVPVLFLTVFLLGLLSFWTAPVEQDADALYQAHAHFLGGSALIDDMLSQPSAQSNQAVLFAIGSYLYWDMACSFVIESQQQRPLYTVPFFAAVQELHKTYHPILGYSAEITYLCAKVGRYCRSVVDTGERDLALEKILQEEVEQWQPNRDCPELGVLGEAYHSHALINLYTIYRNSAIEYPISGECEISKDEQEWDFNLLHAPFEPDRLEWLDYSPRTTGSPTSSPSIGDAGDGSSTIDYFAEYHEEDEASGSIAGKDLETSIHDLALKTVRSLMKVPDSHPCINLHGIPLLTAGSELRAEDTEERHFVTSRFRAMYSLNHLPANLTALDLLEEVWALRDVGIVVSWFELMHQKGWQVMLG